MRGRLRSFWARPIQTTTALRAERTAEAIYSPVASTVYLIPHTFAGSCPEMIISV